MGPVTRRLLLAMVVMAGCAAAAAACGGDAPSPDAAPAPDAGPPGPDAGDLRGEVRVWESNVGAWGASSQISATFYQVREPRWHQPFLSEGDCTLYRFRNDICDPPCTNGLCVAPNVCEPLPDFTPAGTLTVTGVATGPVVIDPDVYGYYYNPTALPADLFADDATVTATLTGAGDLPPLALSAGGVTPVRPPVANDEITLENGQDFTISWTPGGGERVRLTLNANNQGHGAPYAAIIRCDVPDGDGAITVPSAIIDAFEETFRWEICAGSDCPLSSLMRYRQDTAQAPGGHVSLIVGNEIKFFVIHAAP